MKRLLVVALVVMSSVAVGLATRSSRGSGSRIRQADSRQVLRGPTNWVPFVADITRVNEEGLVQVGTFYRASDGSTRSETGPSLSNILVVGIKNIPQKTLYLWHQNSGWESHPMDLPPVGWNPRGLRVSPDEIITDTVEGFNLIRKSQQQGVYVDLAPQLNFFALRSTHPCTTQQVTSCGLWYSHIQIGEQRQEYFQPPAGVTVSQRSEPSGIVKMR